MKRTALEQYRYEMTCSQEEYDSTVRKSVKVFIYAHKGDVRYFKGRIGKSIRRALGIRKWGSAPHNVVYWSIQRAAWYCGGDSPFFEADLTSNEVDAIMAALREDLGERGWDIGGEDFAR